MLTADLARRLSDYEPGPAVLGVNVDYFAGGGGWSTGVERAYGRKVDLAVNHDPEALAMHEANHPDTFHAVCDVHDFPIVKWLGKRPWNLWTVSPDCTHHSRAKGAKPVSNKRRSLANVVIEVLRQLPMWQRPRVILLENVPEFLEWGPLLENGRPDPDRKGEDFVAWREGVRGLGYSKIETFIDVAADHGDPTTRKRLIVVCRCDGLPIERPRPTHYNPKAKLKAGVSRRGMTPWRTAADCIDFSIPGRSIFGRKKELADATKRRVARGVKRFVIDNPNRYIVPGRRIAGIGFNSGCTDDAGCIIPLTHHGDRREHPLDEPVPTITCANRGELALISTHITKFRAGSTGHGMDEPMHTITANSFQKRPGGAAPIGLVEAAMAPFVAGVTQSSTPRVFPADAPLPTITTAKGGELMVAAPFLSRVDMASASARNGIAGPDEPVRAITTAGPFAVVSPVLVGCGGRAGLSPEKPPTDPLNTVTTKADTVVATAHMLRLQGSDRRDAAIDDPLGAVCAQGTHYAQVAAFMAQHNLGNDGHPMDVPVSTIVEKGCTQGFVEVDLTPADIEAGCERVLAFMLKYYGTNDAGVAIDKPIDTITAEDRFALITVHIGGVPYRIFDIRIRMLTPRELFNAQGFPPNYNIRPWVQSIPKPRKADLRADRVRVISKRMSKSSAIAKCGNSVPPGMAYAWAKATAPPMSRLEGRDRWASQVAA